MLLVVNLHSSVIASMRFARIVAGAGSSELGSGDPFSFLQRTVLHAHYHMSVTGYILRRIPTFGGFTIILKNQNLNRASHP